MPGKIGNRKMKPCKTELGRFVRERRLALGLGQVALNQLADFTGNLISAIELGNRKCLKDEQLYRLAQALQCSEEELRSRMPIKPVAKPKTELGHFIRTRREELGLSIQVFAQRMEITVSQVKQLENGKHRWLHSARIKELAKALELDLSVFARFAGPKQKDAIGPLGKLVRARRKELGMSAEELAKKLHVARQYVDAIEYGKSNLSGGDDMIDRLAKALELDVNVLKAVRARRKYKKCSRDPTSIGVLIRERRVEQGLTQRELADRTGISALTVSHIEIGRHSPSLSTLQKLMQALEMVSSETLGLDVSVLKAVRAKRKYKKCSRDPTSIGILIRERRMEQGLTQRELADRAGISQTTVSQIETGRYLPYLSTLRKVMRALGMDTLQIPSVLKETHGPA